MKNPWIIVVVLLVVGIGYGFTQLPEPNAAPAPATAPTPAPAPAPVRHVPPKKTTGRTIMLHTVDWEFQPSTITVKQGEDVSLHLMGIQGDHGVAIPGLGISETMFAGSNKLVKIPTDKPGTYDFFCNVACGSGHADMTGTIVIQ